MDFMTQWEPRRELGRLSNEMERLFGDLIGRRTGQDPVATSAWAPLVDIRETKDALELTVELPGIDPEAVDVTVDNGVLTIRGERSGEKSVEDVVYHRVERAFGVFERRFALPRSVDPDRIQASYRHGVLVLTVPKRDEAKPRSVKVKVEG